MSARPCFENYTDRLCSRFAAGSSCSSRRHRPNLADRPYCKTWAVWALDRTWSTDFVAVLLGARLTAAVVVVAVAVVGLVEIEIVIVS